MKLVITVWIFREKIENLSSGAHVLHITSNLVNSRRCQDVEGGIENTRAGHAELLFVLIRPIVSCLCLSSLIWPSSKHGQNVRDLPLRTAVISLTPHTDLHLHICFLIYDKQVSEFQETRERLNVNPGRQRHPKSTQYPPRHSF